MAVAVELVLTIDVFFQRDSHSDINGELRMTMLVSTTFVKRKKNIKGLPEAWYLLPKEVTVRGFFGQAGHVLGKDP